VLDRRELDIPPAPFSKLLLLSPGSSEFERLQFDDGEESAFRARDADSSSS